MYHNDPFWGRNPSDLTIMPTMSGPIDASRFHGEYAETQARLLKKNLEAPIRLLVVDR